MTAYWSGSQWKEFENDERLDYEDSDWLSSHPAKPEMQAGGPWEMNNHAMSIED